MKTARGFFAWSVVFGLLCAACNKSSSVSESSFPAVTGSEIDETKVSTLSGVPIKILKTDSIGFPIINRFYWIRVQGRPPKGKLEEISRKVLDEVIAAKPKLYHSFTLHFVSSEDFRAGIEQNTCFAKATFLPDGNWQKVGRDPIDGYSGYKLDCFINDPR